MRCGRRNRPCAQAGCAVLWGTGRGRALDHRALQRLHLAAGAGNAICFLYRPARVQAIPSPAPLRIRLAAQAGALPPPREVRGALRAEPGRCSRSHAVGCTLGASRAAGSTARPLPPVWPEIRRCCGSRSTRWPATRSRPAGKRARCRRRRSGRAGTVRQPRRRANAWRRICPWPPPARSPAARRAGAGRGRRNEALQPRQLGLPVHAGRGLQPDEGLLLEVGRRSNCTAGSSHCAASGTAWRSSAITPSGRGTHAAGGCCSRRHGTPDCRYAVHYRTRLREHLDDLPLTLLGWPDDVLMPLDASASAASAVPGTAARRLHPALRVGMPARLDRAVARCPTHDAISRRPRPSPAVASSASGDRALALLFPLNRLLRDGRLASQPRRRRSAWHLVSSITAGRPSR